MPIRATAVTLKPINKEFKEFTTPKTKIQALQNIANVNKFVHPEIADYDYEKLGKYADEISKWHVGNLEKAEIETTRTATDFAKFILASKKTADLFHKNVSSFFMTDQRKAESGIKDIVERNSSVIYRRTSNGNCCDWCSDLIGDWDTDEVNGVSVFAKHKGCVCEVEIIHEREKGDEPALISENLNGEKLGENDEDDAEEEE